ncbi:hypothetical protein HPB51_029082 [Rhipicephalus microplus]|uniref:Uncharacterized protein n=1 Tax=Rhipicephalus microplus TaxID=6941 RepID=A0A9J6CVV5_RHIMP|nr:hypothetical protein HPB51_029082 [Rhipicephalus microplus]
MDRKRRAEDTSASEEFREKEHVEIKPRIVEEGVEAEGIAARQRECLCVAQRPAEPRELGDAKELALVAQKLGQLTYRSSKAWNLAEYEPWPAAACTAGTCPGSDHSDDAGKQDSDRVLENFSKHRVPFGGQRIATSVRQLDVLEEEKLTRKNFHPHRGVKRKMGRLLEWKQCCVYHVESYLGRVAGSSCRVPDDEEHPVVNGLSVPTIGTKLIKFQASCREYLIHGLNYAEVGFLS